jgi:spore maturation protein CgeB
LRLLIIGNRHGTSVGGSFERAARDLAWDVAMLESRQAMGGPAWLRRVNWWLGGKRPPRLRQFGFSALDLAESFGASHVLATGIAPLSADVLKRLRKRGIVLINYLTDDPFNRQHRAPWFIETLALYDAVASPRQGNLEDLRSAGASARYVPFAYDPYFTDTPLNGNSARESDVFFAGGADRDRVGVVSEFIRAGFDVHLYGDYWNRYRQTRDCYKGYADAAELRAATSGARVALCLVRRANRDGHSMRTFELAAVGACMLVEDTPEHRDLFGNDMERVAFFRDAPEGIAKARALLADPAERLRLARSVRSFIRAGDHTYRHRLLTLCSS